MERNRPELGVLETAVLVVLWDRGPSTVAEAAQALPKERGRHPNTVGTVLNRMAARGLVARDDSGSSARYAALVSREEMARRHLDVLRGELLGGSLTHFVAALVRPGGAKKRHAEKLTKLLEEIESEEKRGR